MVKQVPLTQIQTSSNSLNETKHCVHYLGKNSELLRVLMLILCSIISMSPWNTENIG